MIEKQASSIGSKMKGARFVRVSRARPQMAGMEQLQLRYRNLWLCMCVDGCLDVWSCVVMTLGESIEVPAVGMEEHLSSDSKVSETISHMG